MTKRIFTYHHLIIIFLLLITSTFCFSQPANVSEQITSAARKALNQKAKRLADPLNAKRYDVHVGKLPRGVTFELCQHEPSVEFITREQPGEQRMQIYCEKPSRWSIYYQGQIDLFVAVITSKRTMSAGETPSRKDVNLQIRNISELKRGYLIDFKQLNHKQIAKRVKIGDIITPAMLKPAWLVKRGERISLRVDEGSFNIEMPGKALENGTLGEQIRVKNLSSGKILYGVISGSNQVDIL